RSFEKQGEATSFFKAMLNRYRPGERVNDEDSLDLAALLERHTEYVAKVGCGVSHFEVMLTDHGTQCFRIVRTDGSGTDFSYPHCIAQRSPTRKQEVSQAFRRAVRFDLYRARDSFFASHVGGDGCVSCAVTGDRVPRDTGHMDHRPPMTFEVIVTTFLAGRGMSLADVPLTSGRDDQVSPEITDETLSDAFRKYHTAVARLDFVKNTVNLAQASQNRLKQGRITL
ncbi:MAG: DCL family protein, partial [Sneathiellaceae bacterium]